MAEIIENEEKQEIKEEIPEDTTKELGESQPEVAEEKAEEKSITDIFPEKYRGKKIEDIIKMHQESEKLIGRQAQEVGEVRKLADELLRTQLTKKAEDPVPEVDFFDNPEEAIRRSVETNPKVLAAEQYAIHAYREQAKQVLSSKHPDMNALIADPEFIGWVKDSRIRTELFKQADAYNVDAADELFSTYKQLKAVKVKQDKSEDEISRKTKLKAASVDSSGTMESTKKIYRRADLIRLKMKDPSRYEAMNDEINLAYQEGRVK